MRWHAVVWCGARLAHCMLARLRVWPHQLEEHRVFGAAVKWKRKERLCVLVDLAAVCRFG